MASPPEFSTSDLDLLEQLAVHEAREDFWAYRQYLTPKIKIGWWQREIAGHLQQFRDDLLAGTRPILIITAPPQHGKSFQVLEFITWLVGHDPDLRCIYASFSERLGVRANLRLQRVFDGEKYKRLFPGTRINSSNVVTISGQHLRNREILEFVDREGYFRNTTVRGSVTGEGLDLGIIDDPIKGREEANSETIREKTWDWFNDDFFTRFSENAGLLFILTRWHIDDPAGRLIEANPAVKVLRYPAIAEFDEPHRKAGDPLFPEHKSLGFLMDRRTQMTPASWEALYQQNPIVAGGNLFKSEWFLEHDEPPRIKWRSIYVDTAQKTKERNDYSVFEHWGQGIDGKAYLLGLTRGRFEAPELEATAIRLWNEAAKLDKDRWGHLRKMAIEDKVSGTGLIQGLKRKAIPVFPIQREKDKYTRAQDIVPSVAAGLVSIPKSAPWKRDFMSEVLAFPDGAHDDQCLIAGTMVETGSGALPIEEIRPGDMVLTRSGYRRVKWAGITNHAAKIMTVEFSDGRTLTGTHAHPVWVDGAGFVRLDSIVGAGYSLICRENSLHSTLTPLPSTASCSVDTLDQSRSRTGATTHPVAAMPCRGWRRFIGRFGSIILGRSPGASKYTTLTGILSTTASKISAASAMMSTKEFTLPRGRGSLHPPFRSTWRKYGLLQPHGTRPKKGANGMPIRRESPWTPVCQWISRAVNVARRSSQKSSAVKDQMGSAFVLGNAVPLSSGERVGTGCRSSAQNAGGNSLVYPAPEHALVRAVRAFDHGTLAPVYNLTVEDCHEFYANGVLVHNCDPMMDAVLDMCGAPRLIIPDAALERSRGFRL